MALASIPLVLDAAAQVWTNMPAALTEFRALTIYRMKADLTNASSVRLVARQEVAGSANAQLRVQYALTEAGTWTDLCSVAVGLLTGVKAGAWSALPAAAKADVFLRLVGISGDGVADPSFGAIYLQAR